jgi:tetratricopeptide (TPR) repeat protein
MSFPSLILATRQVCQQVIKPLTARSRGSFCDELAAAAPQLLGPATCFISHTWGYSFADVIDAILLYFEPLPAPQQQRVVLWIDFFCDSQHARLPSWPPPDVVKNSKWFMDNFADLIASIGAVLMIMQPWNAPLTLTRCWCVLELGHCARKGCKFDIAFTADERDRFLNAMRSDSACLLDVIANVNSLKSSCSRPEDRLEILSGIEGSIGFTKLDRMVFEVLDTWQLQALNNQAHTCEKNGTEHASWFNSLGRLHYEQGSINEAEACFSKAAAAACNQRGPSDVTFLIAQTNLAVVRYAIARDPEQILRQFSVTEARMMLADTVAICRKALKPDDALLATAVLQLADMHRDLGNLDTAKDLYHEALQNMRVSNREVAATVAKVGLALVAQEKAQYQEALFMLDDAYQECAAATGADHPVAVTCRMRQALCLLEAEKGNTSEIWRSCVMTWLPSPFTQLCGCEPSKYNVRVYHPVKHAAVGALQEQQAASSTARLNDQFPDASEFLRSDPGYALLADSFERCSRTLGFQHPQTQCAHAWLQVVEAMGRQRPKSDGKSCNRSPICIIIIAVFVSLAVFMSYGAYTLFEYMNALDLWRVQGRSEVVTSPTPVVLNASAAKYLHAVGPSFRFDGRVVLCGDRPFFTQQVSHFGVFLSQVRQILRVCHRCRTR